MYIYKNIANRFDRHEKVLTFVKSFKIMTDKEKIELIMQDKHLNNTQFCNEVCIAQGTLSHIRSGRTEPTLNILRSIAQAFPDINPAWLFYGEEPMYKNASSPAPENDEADDDAHINNMSPTAALPDAQLPLFAFPDDASKPSSKGSAAETSSAATSPSAAPRRSSGNNIPVYATLDVQDIVAETLKQQQKPQRKIVEVRIFFDDGTFETFSNK